MSYDHFAHPKLRVQPSPSGPRRLGFKPPIPRQTQNRDQAIAITCRVIEKNGIVSTLYCNGKIFEAALIASPNIFLGNIVTSRQDPVSDSSQIDLDIFCSDINQPDLDSARLRVQHHL